MDEKFEAVRKLQTQLAEIGVCHAAVFNKHARLMDKKTSVKIGPIALETPICWDSGCNSMLLPWPTALSSLEELINDPSKVKARGFALDNGVRGLHATFIIHLHDAVDFTIGQTVLTKVNLMRFVVTLESKKWLEALGIDCSSLDMEHIWTENRKFALIGQSVLSSVRSYQSRSSGLVFFSSEAKNVSLPDVDKLLVEYRSIISSSKWLGDAWDLEDQDHDAGCLIDSWEACIESEAMVDE